MYHSFNPIYIGLKEKPIPIPEGYVISEVEGENKIEDGLVIYEGTEPVTESNHEDAMLNRNQYVWIPVEDINDMVMCSSNNKLSDSEENKTCNLVYKDGENGGILKCTTPAHSGTATDLVGRLYTSIQTGNNPYAYKMDFSKIDQTYTSSNSYHEPNTVNYDADNKLYLEDFKSDFTAMAKSVAKNGGFYISRYEIGEDGNSRKGQKVLTAASSDGGSGATAYLGADTWYNLYKTIRDDNSNRQMIWGCQYDQVMKFIGDEAQIGHNDRNLTTTHALSGQNELDKMKNIYDLEGNNLEWTQEADSTSGRVHRGSFYSNSRVSIFYPASYRSAYIPTFSYDYLASRSTIYL